MICNVRLHPRRNPNPRSHPHHPHNPVSNRQLACPSNTLSDAGAGSAVDCKPQPGFYGDNGNAASVCPTGFYCAGGSAVARCPVGTTSAQGASAVGQCSVMRSYYGR